MKTEPVYIEGLAGPVVITTNSFTGKQSVTVDGTPVTGTRRGDYTLPGAGGKSVEAKVRSNLFDAYPTIEIGGVKHLTGPTTPLALKIMALLPLVLIGIGGALGAAFGVVAVITNFTVIRGTQKPVIKALLMLGTLVAASVVWLILAASIRSAISA